MNIDANIAAHLSVGPNVNGQQNLTGFVEFFFTSICHGWNASYEKVLSTWIEVPYSSKKVNLLHRNYCTNYIHSLLQHLHS